MKNFLKAFYRKKWLFWPLVALVVILGYQVVKGGTEIADEFITVSRGDVVETVTATGTVRPKNAASLRFESAGTIATLKAEVGDAVVKGQLLATLNAGDLRQKVIQAEAELAAMQVALSNAGQSVGDTRIKNEQTLATAYSDALAGLGEVLNLAQTTNDTVKSIYDQASVSGRLDELKKMKDAYETTVFALKNLTPTASRTEIESALAKVYSPLLAIQQVTIALIKELKTLSSSDANNAYRTSAADAQADINDAVAKVAGYAKAIADAKTNNVLENNTSAASYKTAQAQVETARAAVAIAQANLTNASLYAPISGVIASKSKSIGEGVTATDQVYYVLGEGGLEVTAHIPEIDIAKLAVGNPATVVLDAYGSENPFAVTVKAIDPAETVIDGVATYKTTFAFNADDARIRSGMTANIIVSTQAKEQVLVIPFRAISLVGGEKTVKVLRGNERVQTVVKLGLRGNNGLVEVLDGLAEGDVVVIEKQ